MFAVNRTWKQKRRFVFITAIFLAAFLFSSVMAFAQNDTLVLLGRNMEADECYAISAFNGNAFVANFVSGLKIFSYSDPETPSLVTTYAGLVYDVRMQDSWVYYSGDCFTISDISNPLEPDTIGRCCCYELFQGNLHLSDSLTFTLLRLPYEAVALMIIDISDPTDPYLLSMTGAPPPGTTHGGDIFVKGNYLYWADKVLFGNLGRILVFDISDPAEPVPIVADTCLHAPPHAIWIKDNYAYVAEGYGGVGLMVFDISDPYDIDSVGCFPIPEGRAWNVYVKGKYAYVCSHLQPTLEWDRIYVLDISDPTSPSLVTYYNTLGSPRDVIVDEPYVLVADYTSLLIFQGSFLTIPGDANGDGQVNAGDVVFIINYLYRQGTPPETSETADVNGDCVVNASDVIYLLNYLFRGGPPPQNGCAF
jgi:hypothetical protein